MQQTTLHFEEANKTVLITTPHLLSVARHKTRYFIIWRAYTTHARRLYTYIKNLRTYTQPYYGSIYALKRILDPVVYWSNPISTTP